MVVFVVTKTLVIIQHHTAR